MSGFIDFILSINKIALVAFIAVLGFLIYEIKKTVDEKSKKAKPVVPQFNNTTQVSTPVALNSTPLPPMPNLHTNKKEGAPLLMIIIGIISLVSVIVLIIISFQINQKKKNIETTSVPIIREITSAGLKIYDQSWKEIESKGNDQAQPGQKLYIGIQTIIEADIDRARIKVNTNVWEIADITELFNPQLKVYYKEYTVATGTAQLKIEAQLHSASDGWLGD